MNINQVRRRFDVDKIFRNPDICKGERIAWYMDARYELDKLMWRPEVTASETYQLMEIKKAVVKAECLERYDYIPQNAI